MPASAIALFRKRRRWSRVDLATAAGVTESTIVRAEGATPPAIQARNLEKIARALDVPIAALMELSQGAPGPDDLDDAQELAAAPDADVLLIYDLARALRTTVRRLRAILKAEPWRLPERLPPIDTRDRWSRIVVDRWLEQRDADRRRQANGIRATAGR